MRAKSKSHSIRRFYLLYRVAFIYNIPKIKWHSDKLYYKFGVAYLPVCHIQFLWICRAVRSEIMTGNKSITVYRIRRGRRKHRTKQKAPKQSDDYHDGHIKHADRTAKFTRIFQAGKFGCFYFTYFVKNIRPPPFLHIEITKSIWRKEK